MKNIKLILYLILVLTVLSFASSYAQSKTNLVVLVKYKTLPGKDSIGLAELKSLIDKVKNEPNFVNIIVHVDQMDKSNILLYEQWSDEMYYKGDHLTTQHLQQFMVDSRSFLAGPPEISFWKINN